MDFSRCLLNRAGHQLHIQYVECAGHNVLFQVVVEDPTSNLVLIKWEGLITMIKGGTNLGESDLEIIDF